MEQCESCLQRMGCWKKVTFKLQNMGQQWKIPNKTCLNSMSIPSWEMKCFFFAKNEASWPTDINRYCVTHLDTIHVLKFIKPKHGRFTSQKKWSKQFMKQYISWTYHPWCTPKFLDRFNCESKGENNIRRSGDTFPSLQHFKGKKACKSFRMGNKTSDKRVNYSHGPAQTKQQVG
jgi:hypothetical protein